MFQRFNCTSFTLSSKSCRCSIACQSSISFHFRSIQSAKGSSTGVVGVAGVAGVVGVFVVLLCILPKCLGSKDRKVGTTDCFFVSRFMRVFGSGRGGGCGYGRGGGAAASL